MTWDLYKRDSMDRWIDESTLNSYDLCDAKVHRTTKQTHSTHPINIHINIHTRIDISIHRTNQTNQTNQ
jgi:hypothetical protein